MEPTYQLARAIIKPWFATWFRWSIEGTENIPRHGPAIVAFNHIAYLDPLVAAYAVDRLGRRPRFLAKSELFTDKRIAWILRGAKQIEVKRGTKEAPMALDHAIGALSRGEIVVIFPEGTITTNPDLEPMEAKTGLARLALAADAPVVPAAIWGTANVWPKGFAKHWAPRQDILIRFGEAVTYEGDPGDRNEWKRVGVDVMERIAVELAAIRPAVPDRRRTKGAR